MKLPKGFGFGGGGGEGLMSQMQNAMARANNMEQELEQKEFTIDNGPVKAVFDGVGRVKKLTIDPVAVDPEDVEALEDLITGVMRAGFEKSLEIRNEVMAEIRQHLPNIPGLNL